MHHRLPLHPKVFLNIRSTQQANLQFQMCTLVFLSPSGLPTLCLLFSHARVTIKPNDITDPKQNQAPESCG